MHDLSVAESGTASVCVVLLSVGEGLQRDVVLQTRVITSTAGLPIAYSILY